MDIKGMSEEDKNALIEELLQERLAAKQSEGSGQKVIDQSSGSSNGPQKIDHKEKSQSKANSRMVIPMNQREHHNEFDKIAKTFKAEGDAKLRKEDKKNWDGADISPRKPPPDLYRINCKNCNKTFEVYGHQLTSDPDEGTVYVCNKCSLRGG